MLKAAALLPIASRLPRPASVTVPTRLSDGSVTPFRLEHPTDLIVISEIFEEGQYENPPLRAPKLIIDAGSHIGTSVSYFATRYPGARVVALEASPRTFSRLEKHVERLPNVEVLNVALGAGNGTAQFVERKASWESSFAPARDDEKSIPIPVSTLDSVLDRVGAERVDLLKLDIEGAEYDVLRASPPDPDRIVAIVGELHTWIDGVEFTAAEFFDLRKGCDVEDDQSGRDHVFRATRRLGA